MVGFRRGWGVSVLLPRGRRGESAVVVCGLWCVVVGWLAGWLPAAKKETSHTMPNDNVAKRNETYLGHGFTHAHTQLGADVGELIALIEQKRCLDLANHHDELLLV